MRVQPLPPALLEEAVDLWRRTGLTRPWNDPQDDACRALGGPSSTILAGFDGDMLSAGGMVGHDGHRGWVYYLAIAPEAQGRGHGRTMMQACEAWLVDRHLPKLKPDGSPREHGCAGVLRALDYDPDEVIVLSRRLER